MEDSYKYVYMCNIFIRIRGVCVDCLICLRLFDKLIIYKRWLLKANVTDLIFILFLIFCTLYTDVSLLCK